MRKGKRLLFLLHFSFACFPICLYLTTLAFLKGLKENSTIFSCSCRFLVFWWPPSSSFCRWWFFAAFSIIIGSCWETARQILLSLFQLHFFFTPTSSIHFLSYSNALAHFDGIRIFYFCVFQSFPLSKQHISSKRFADFGTCCCAFLVLFVVVAKVRVAMFFALLYFRAILFPFFFSIILSWTIPHTGGFYRDFFKNSFRFLLVRLSSHTAKRRFLPRKILAS